MQPSSPYQNPNQGQNFSQSLEPKTSWGYLIIIGVVALLIGGGVGGYLRWVVKPQLEKGFESINAQSRSNEEEQLAEEQGSEWQTFSESDVNFTFEYPAGWVVKEKYYYETAAGEKAKEPTIILCPVEVNDYTVNNLGCTSCISFNVRQQACADFNPALKMETIGNNQVCCSGGDNPTRDEIITKIKETFKTK